MSRKTRSALAMGLGLLALSLAGSRASWSQTIEVPTTVFFGDSPPGSRSTFSSSQNSIPSISVATDLPLINLAASTAFNEEICGGIGAPTQAAAESFDNSLEAFVMEDTRSSTRRQLAQSIVESARDLGREVAREIETRDLTPGQSTECDSLLRAIVELQQAALDVATALQDADKDIYW